MELKLANIGTNLKWIVFFTLINIATGYRYYYSYYRSYRYYYTYRYYRSYYYYYYYYNYSYSNSYYYYSGDAGVIVGGVFGGIFGFTFLTVLIVVCCRMYLNASSSSSTTTTGRVVMAPTVTTIATIDTEMATPTVVHVDGGMENPTYKATFQPPPPYSELEHPDPAIGDGVVNVNHVEGIEAVGPVPEPPMGMGMPNADPTAVDKI